MRLLGRNDIEDALKRLDTLTQEEARLTTAEVWEVARSVDDKVKVVIDGAQKLDYLAIRVILSGNMARRKRDTRGYSTGRQ
jgi:hypothetical protein